MTDLLTAENLMAFLTLTSLEVVLGIDNVIFIAILADKTGPDMRDRARKLGLLAAVVTRLILLACIGWLATLTTPLFTIEALHLHPTGKDLILLGGGLFLIGKATYEIHHKIEADDDHHASGGTPKHASLGSVLVQIALIDIVFSLDSVITAIGMVQATPEKYWTGMTIMVSAVLCSVGVMLWFSGAVVGFINKHPTIKILALSFLLLIGVLLVAEAFHQKIDKGYIYFAMAFALGVDLLQMRMTSKAAKRFKPLPTSPDDEPALTGEGFTGGGKH
ncbi:MAG TPA: TerC family protein [Pirellulales bacterium]